MKFCILKKVLIITYYWPPSGGAGVQRWLKMSKYMREFGWEPVIYTAENPEYPIIDLSLEKDVLPGMRVIRRPIWEPYNLYKKIIGQNQGQKVYSGFLSEDKPRSFSQKLSIWVRGNFFIPDARCFWIKPSIKFLVEELKRDPVDAIISTGTPHSMHLIAKGIKEKLGLPWLADFRDTWTTIDFYNQLMLTRWADRKHHRLEKEVLTKADRVTTVSWHWAEELSKISGKKVDVVTNGYDEEDYINLKGRSDGKFAIHHIGLLSSERKLTGFWRAIKELVDEVPSFKNDLIIRLSGKVDHAVLKEAASRGLDSFIENKGYLSHKEALQMQVDATILLLVLNDVPNSKGHIPGKLFEYLAARKPIIGIGPIDGDAARIVRETNSGMFFDFTNIAEIKMLLNNHYQLFLHGKLNGLRVDIEHYSRKDLSHIVSSIISLI